MSAFLEVVTSLLSQPTASVCKKALELLAGKLQPITAQSLSSNEVSRSGVVIRCMVLAYQSAIICHVAIMISIIIQFYACLQYVRKFIELKKI